MQNRPSTAAIKRSVSTEKRNCSSAISRQSVAAVKKSKLEQYLGVQPAIKVARPQTVKPTITTDFRRRRCEKLKA